MRSRFGWIVLLLATWVCCCASQAAFGQSIGFAEQFALAKDRAEVLKQLIPGTEDYYYYHCLHYQNLEKYEEVEKLLPVWVSRHGETARYQEMVTRHYLLIYPKDRARSLDWIKRKLSLTFAHERPPIGEKPNLPEQLDPALISREALSKRAMAQHGNLDGFEDRAFDWLMAQPLDAGRRRNLLERLTWPDFPGLAKLVADDLKEQNSGGFGSLPIHGQLLLAQLDELLKLKPDVRDNSAFVQTYLAKLAPGHDEDATTDVVVREAFLDRLWNFAKPLAPAHNSLKANILYHRLVHDRALGKWNKDRFLAYLALPRHVFYIEPKYLAAPSRQSVAADMNFDASDFTNLPIVGNDEPLVRSYLMHFLMEAADAKEFEPFIESNYLKQVFAETKILAGLGDAEKWTALLAPEQYQALKDRVDLEFAHENKSQFGVGDPVSLEVDIKNVKTLLVKVFEIRTGQFYRTTGAEIDTDINLDGLVASEEQRVTYDLPPLRRQRHKFEFPSIDKAGVYVIDFIGGGKSSRVLVRKGRLHPIVAPSPVGLQVMVLNERREHIKDASLWLEGTTYNADEKGVIQIPFTTEEAAKSVVLSQGEFSSLAELEIPGEEYSLRTAFHIDRESLRSRKTAKLILRAQLLVNGFPAPLGMFEEPKLTITSTDHDGIVNTKEVKELKLDEKHEFVYEFQTPPRLTNLMVTLSGSVKSFLKNQPVPLTSSRSFDLNLIDRGMRVYDFHLVKTAEGYHLECRGKTGELRPQIPFQLTLKHEAFREPIQVSLKTNDKGRTLLGPLVGISSIRVPTGNAGEGQPGENYWSLAKDARLASRTIHAMAGEEIRVPYLGKATKATREEFSIVQSNHGGFVSEHFAALSLENGFLVAKDLTAGDYDLKIKSTKEEFTIRIAAGKTEFGVVMGKVRQLQTRDNRAVHIVSLEANEKSVVAKVGNANPSTRVHVIATRFQPQFSALTDLGAISRPGLGMSFSPRWDSSYVSGRKIGDEYQYILDRRQLKKYVGNMLERPSLLLNPWSIRKTSTELEKLAMGNDFDAAGAVPAPVVMEPESEDRIILKQSREGRGQPRVNANLDFLAGNPLVALNLPVEADGTVTIDREALGEKQWVHVILVDAESTEYRQIALPETKTSIFDLRLAKAYPADQAFAEQRKVTLLQKGGEFAVDDLSIAKIEPFDNLRSAHRLLLTLSGNNATLAEFGFLLDWPKLKLEEKRAKYSQYACHELHFFLLKKDPEFFAAVVKPYLANKKDKTFLDLYLLEADLAAFTKPWAYVRLNTVERILLAQRIESEFAATKLLLRDQVEMIPLNVALDAQKFKTSVYFGLLGDRSSGVEELQNVFLDIDRSAIPFGDESAPLSLGISARRTRESVSNGADFAKNSDTGLGRLGSARLNDADEKPASANDRQIEPPASEMPSDAPTDKSPESKSEMAGKKLAGKSAELFEKQQAMVDRYENHFQEGKFGGGYKIMDFKKLNRPFIPLDNTEEWAENNYYKLRIAQQNAGLTPPNRFWRDYVNHDGAAPFLSQHLSDATATFTEMMFALAVLDLPFESPKHEEKVDGLKYALRAAGPMIIFHECIMPTSKKAESTSVLVSQNLFRADDRFNMVEGVQVDKFADAEFLIHTVYGCQVVVTNPTSASQRIDLLVQIPQGALPVANGQATKSIALQLEPYATQKVEYFFYFPAPGEAPHYGAQASRDGVLLTSIPSKVLEVVAALKSFDKESWEYVSVYGSDEEVLAFLKVKNLESIDLARIAYRMKSAKFFADAIAILASRHRFDAVLWSYSVQHDAPEAMREYLQFHDAIANQCGAAIVSPLLVIDPVERRTYEHLDYRPLINPRAYQLGRERVILNDALRGQYQQLVTILGYRRNLSDADKMAVIYYLLLQDRFDESLDFWSQVDKTKLAEQLQYDYFAAYLKMVQADPAAAKEIALKYAEHPVDRWRTAFASIVQQVNEIDGGSAKVIDDKSREQTQAELAAKEPSFDFNVEAKKVKVTHQNLSELTINYYLMDLELLFSNNPFVQQGAGHFSFVRPNLTKKITLEKGVASTEFDLPEQFQQSNVLVEIEGGGKTAAKAYYANSLTVQMLENYGQVRVTSPDQKPVSGAYVKVYSRDASGQVKFFKDGYTDLRGRFDYASVSSNEVKEVEKFSMLISSEKHGAVVRETDPPRR